MQGKCVLQCLACSDGSKLYQSQLHPLLHWPHLIIRCNHDIFKLDDHEKQLIHIIIYFGFLTKLLTLFLSVIKGLVIVCWRDSRGEYHDTACRVCMLSVVWTVDFFWYCHPHEILHDRFTILVSGTANTVR